MTVIQTKLRVGILVVCALMACSTGIVAQEPAKPTANKIPEGLKDAWYIASLRLPVFTDIISRESGAYGEFTLNGPVVESLRSSYSGRTVVGAVGQPDYFMLGNRLARYHRDTGKYNHVSK